MIRLAPFKLSHLEDLIPQEAQAYSKPVNLEQLATIPPELSFSGMVDNVPVICAGVFPKWRGTGIAWALVSRSAGPYMVKITKYVNTFLDFANYVFPRVEATVDHRFSYGHRWVSCLGFKHEGLMIGYSPDGLDFDLYARFR
jgi:hypothetical protein